MADRDYVFTDEALREQDGKQVPLTREPGGPVIGEATLKYDPETGDLNADIRIDDPKLAEFLNGTAPIIKRRA
jgi:hypothetical protein